MNDSRTTEGEIQVGQEICFSRDEAAGLAIRVEDAMKIMSRLLDGAEDSTHPNDWKRQTLIIMARDRNRHLEYVVSRLRGEPRP